MTVFRYQPPPPDTPGVHWVGRLVKFGFNGFRLQYFPVYDASTAARPSNPSISAPPPPQGQQTYDTIGQVIWRTIGDCRTPLVPIWVSAINTSVTIPIDQGGQGLSSPIATVALAMSQPIDPDELGTFDTLFDGDKAIFSIAGGIVPPDSWSDEDKAHLLSVTFASQFFPGDQAQLPAAVIVADKGVQRTPAWRSLRYIIISNYFLARLSELSAVFKRINDGVKNPTADVAVEFAPGVS